MSDYGFEHHGKVYTPNATPGIDPADNAARNAAIQAAELARWDTKPDRQLAYYHFPKQGGGGGLWRWDFYPTISGAYVTLWPGNRIGRIVSARVYRHNFGGRMVSVTVQGSNGAKYHGRASWDNGTCIHLRKAK